MQNNELYLKELNEQGRTLFSCDKYDEAAKKYEKAMEEDPMYLPSYFNACEAYIMSDQYDKAKKMMKKVLLIDKNNGEAYFHLGNIALLEGNQEEGKIQYAKAINAGNDNPQIYINLASVSEENGEWENALSYYTKAIVRDRTCYVAKIRKTQIYFMLKKYSDALNAADDLIDTNPEIFEGHHLKFVTLATTEKFEEAAAVLDKAQRLFPDDKGFLFDRVKLLELQKQYDDALDMLEQANMDQVPDDVVILEKARLLAALGKNQQAEEVLAEYRGAVNSEIEKLRTAIYVDEKNYKGIFECAEKILGLEQYDSNYFAALYFKAYALKMLGSGEKALTAYREAAKTMQQACAINSGVLDLYIYRAICYRELKEFDKANEMLDYVQAVDDKIAETYYIRYLVYLDLNDTRAEGELNRAKALNPEIQSAFGE